MAAEQAFRQTLLAHRQGRDIQPFQLLPQIPQLFVVYPLVHIAEHHVGFGGAPDLQVFHSQLRIPDATPDQSGVENQRFDKAVVRAAQDFVVLRFLHASGRIGPRVDHHRLIIPLNEKRQGARKHTGDDGRDILRQRHFHIGDKVTGEILGAAPRLHILGFQGHEVFEDLLHHLVFGKSVHKIQGGSFPADKNLASYQIKARPQAQLLFQSRCIGFIASGQRSYVFSHDGPAFLRFCCNQI